ncbi:MAG: phage tail protein [Sphingopyxis sp.]
MVATGALALGWTSITPAAAQSGDFNYIGEIANFGFNYCPRNWASTSGQILGIAQNAALFSLLGTTYGGNGTTTFALPDLRGRTPIGQGQLSGGSFYTLGQVAGTESTTLTTNELPTHTHQARIRVSPNAGTVDSAARNTLASAAETKFQGGATPANNMDTSTLQVAPAGASAPLPLKSPYLTTQYCIALTGIFPSRN